MNLMSDQVAAIDHLRRWRVGALFMEPGTGKTRAALEIIRECSPDYVLWLGPLRTIRTGKGISSVADEIKKWEGANVPIDFVGVESISCSDRIYLETLEELKRHPNAMCIVDESLKIKNANAKRTRHIIELGRYAKYRFILNGTPLSRNIVDLWSQMEFLSHDILRMTHRKYIETFCRMRVISYKTGGKKIWEKQIVTGFENIDYLHSLIRHYVYQCDLHLNISQYYRNRSYELSEYDAEEYRKIKEKYLDIEMLKSRNDNIFIEMTTKMQHAYSISEDKFRCVDEIIKETKGAKIIIFCRFIDSRAECSRRYPDALVLSYQKESFGLNLQDYNVTIYFDKVWDYALRIQSGRRTFRTGQYRDCLYYDVTANTGLDRMIDQNIEKKRGMLEYFKTKSIEEIKQEL